jgi:DNA-binding response OmpR family regulator
MQNMNPRRTIFLVEEDHTVRRPLANRLRQFGYRVLVSADTEDAFEWTSGLGYIHADLILSESRRQATRRSLTHRAPVARAF